MTKSGIRLAAAALACSALSLGACWAEEPKKEGAAPAAEKAAPAAEAPKAAAPAAEAPKAAAPAAEAPKAAAAPAADNPDNAEVEARAKELAIKFEDGRYRDKEGNPVPIVTKDYKVDWGTWDGFRRYHDACHVCHGPNALGSTFAPSLADSLKTMDYTTFVQTVSMGRTVERGGTTYVMPTFGEDRNIMCYIDNIYTYIKARALNATDPATGMPPGRPNGRHDISPESKATAAECFGDK